MSPEVPPSRRKARGGWRAALPAGLELLGRGARTAPGATPGDAAVIAPGETSDAVRTAREGVTGSRGEPPGAALPADVLLGGAAPRSERAGGGLGGRAASRRNLARASSATRAQSEDEAEEEPAKEERGRAPGGERPGGCASSAASSPEVEPREGAPLTPRGLPVRPYLDRCGLSPPAAAPYGREHASRRSSAVRGAWWPWLAPAAFRPPLPPPLAL